MKGGLVCALAAFKALQQLGWQPAGTVGFNAVVDEENTGNGTLATVVALQARDDDLAMGVADRHPHRQAGPCWGTWPAG